ncbi:hypothetical protein L1887_13405 [Cichorium endivia]|nr:hypothetical protein L1887_13405 [Cichorium endivia]
MAALKELLPPVKSSSSTFYDHSSDPWFKQRYSATTEDEHFETIKSNPVPIYNTPERLKYRPSKPQDFGRKKDSSSGPKTLPVTVDKHGNLTFDAIVKQNENASKIVHSQHKDLVPKILKNKEDEDEEEVEKQKKIDETTLQTKAALEKIVNVRLSAAQPKNVATQSQYSKFIKYKPSQQSSAFNSGAKERIIRMVEMPQDPLDPPKFKHKRVPEANGSPPVPVMHSPPRPVTVKDQQVWKIPPCISNWKNPKGYTIPLDKRLAADGRGLQEVQINDNFAKLSETLYVAEPKAREAVTMRSKAQKEMMMKEKERKEQELRALAQKARSERTGAVTTTAVSPTAPPPSGKVVMEVDEREERIQREKIREERRRERERERRLEAKDAAMGKKSKITRERDRDISEKMVLGMASDGAACGGEVMYDQRLFNQEKGMDSGFGTEDQYNVYDKGLFTAQPTLSTLYRPKKDADDEMYGGADEQIEKIRKTERFKPDKAFTGANEKTGPWDRPVEFEREEADPFGLDQFLTEVKGGKKVLDKVERGRWVGV